MPLTKEQTEQIIELCASNCSTIEEVQNFLKKMTWPTLEKLLEWEMESHLWYAKHAKEGYNSWNSRNWTYKKKVRTTNWEIDIDVPRDRNWEFEPEVLPKYESNTSEIEQKIINMYGLWLTTADIVEHIKDIYGANISKTTISTITDKILPEIKERQSRPLEKCYPIVYLDAIHYKVKVSWKYESMAVYVLLWIWISWKKDILGLILWENESAASRQKICNDIANRWVEDILIACIDGLTWFSKAIKNIFPNVEIQKCIIHQIRSSMRYINHKDYKEFMKDLKLIYKADTLEVAEDNLEKLKEKWGKQYSISVNSRIQNRWELSTFFVYPPNIRKIIYTTNTIEGYNRQLRKVTKTTSVFPTEDSLIKLLYLATKNITKKWTPTVSNRGPILWQFESFFPERVIKYLD